VQYSSTTSVTHLPNFLKLKAYDGLTEINHRDKPIKLITKYPIEMPETYGYITNVLHCSKGQFT
jgi:hypothetical protein